MPQSKRRKRSTPKKNAAKPAFSTPDKNSPDYLRTWIENLPRKAKNYYHDEDLQEIISDEDDEFECNLKELEKPLKTLLRSYPDSLIRKRVSIECEWDKCSFECTDATTYDNHVHDHLISDENEKCLWNLCKYEAGYDGDLLRHLDYHAYHTRLKTFGLGLKDTISLPNCQSDSKNRNIIPHPTCDYFCYWDGCKEPFRKIGEFIEHTSNHVDILKKSLEDEKWPTGGGNAKLRDIKVKCQWDGCEQECRNVFQLRRHMKRHTNEKMVGCANCGALFVSKTYFVNHCIRQDPNQRSFQCPDCFRLYPTEKLLKEHTRGHVNKFQCAFCGLSWQKKSTLARHIRYRHLTDKPFECDDCDYRGKTQADLESHNNKHKSGQENLFKCEVFQCDYSSKTLQALKRHDAKIHLGRPPAYQCHCCNLEFERGNFLSKHLIAEHGFKLAPGHSRFVYKQDFDGIYRLQTKRVEDLKEIPATVTKHSEELNVSYEIADICMPENSSMPINVKLREVVRASSTMNTPTYSLFGDESTQDSKDINDFAVVKNYKTIIKKRKLDTSEN